MHKLKVHREHELTERQLRNYEQLMILQKAQDGAANDNFITDEPDMLATMIILLGMAVGIYLFWHVMFEVTCALFQWLGL